jgi:DNA-directed RNA polymerase subunit RPC12/RpoP
MEFRHSQPRDTWITFAWIAGAAGVVVLAGIFSPRLGVGLACLAAVLAVLLLCRWMASAWGYRCPDCNEMFQLTLLAQFTAVNMGDERNVRCPKCGKRHWIKPVRRVG